MKGQEKEEKIIGKNPLIEALRSGREINKIWLAENGDSATRKIVDLARKNGVTIQRVPRKKLDQLAGSGKHQGVIASVAVYRYFSVEELLARSEEKREPPFFLVLDEIEDPHNFGAIIRTADASGVHGIIIPKRRSAALTPAVAKAAAGAVEYVPVARVTNIARTITELKKLGIWVYGAAAEGSEDFRGCDFAGPTALVIGNEGRGLGRLIREKCDLLIRLPMAGNVGSLNASVAAAILMYEVFSQRKPPGAKQ